MAERGQPLRVGADPASSAARATISADRRGDEHGRSAHGGEVDLSWTRILTYRPAAPALHLDLRLGRPTASSDRARAAPPDDASSHVVIGASARGCPRRAALPGRYRRCSRDRGSDVLLAVALWRSPLSCWSKLPARFNVDSWLALVTGREIWQNGLPHHETLTALSHGHRPGSTSSGSRSSASYGALPARRARAARPRQRRAARGPASPAPSSPPGGSAPRRGGDGRSCRWRWP